MLKVNVKPIKDTTDCFVLVGPEGLVWTQPALGDPVILAARNDDERRKVDAFIAALLQMNLVPYGIPTNQRVIQAMFGGPATRDCVWVPAADAPAPRGETGDTLPTQYAIVE